MIEGFLYSLGTAVCKVVSDVTQKRATAIISRDEIIILLQRCFEVVIALVALGVLTYASFDVLRIEGSLLGFLLIVALAAGINFIAFYCNVRALRLSDVSLVSPISQLTPAVLLVTTPLMLGETISSGGVAGVLLVVVGAYILGIKRAHLSLKALRDPIVHLANDRGVRFALLSSILYGISANFDKMGVTMSNPFLFVVASGAAMVIGIFLYSLFNHPSRLSISRQGLQAGMYPGISGGVGSILQMVAYSVWAVPYVIAVKRLSSVFSVISGLLFFGERYAMPRIIGAIIMVGGTATILLFG